MSQQLFQPDFMEPQGYSADVRKAALLLHAMPLEDQRWLLSQLPESQKHELMVLHAEIKELGFPTDRTLLNDVVSALSRRDSKPDHPQDGLVPGPDYLRACLRGFDPEDLATVLKGEPVKLIAQFLEAEAWPWTSRLLELFDDSTREKVQRGLIQGTRPGLEGARSPECDQILLTHVLARVQSQLAIKQKNVPSKSAKHQGWRSLVSLSPAVLGWLMKIAFTAVPSHRRAGFL